MCVDFQDFSSSCDEGGLGFRGSLTNAEDMARNIGLIGIPWRCFIVENRHYEWSVERRGYSRAVYITEAATHHIQYHGTLEWVAIAGPTNHEPESSGIKI